MEIRGADRGFLDKRAKARGEPEQEIPIIASRIQIEILQVGQLLPKVCDDGAHGMI